MRLSLPWRSEPAPVATPARESWKQTSRALALVVQRLAASPRCGVLDLGPPIAENLALYQQHRAKIAIADLYRHFLPLRTGAKASTTLFDALIPHDPSTQFDVILAWDVLNYLSLDQVAALIESLSRFRTPTALMLALVSSKCQIPVSPSNYSIVDEKTLRCEASSERTRPSPEYSEHALTSRMSYATVESRYHLRNQMVEYLFTSR